MESFILRPWGLPRYPALRDTPMPVETLGDPGSKVRRLRPSTLEEDALEAARNLTAPIQDLWPFEPRFFEIENALLHYVDEGPKDAPVMLCVHGNPTWAFMWRKVIERFAGEYRVIALDHMGMGLSERPHDWTQTLASHRTALELLIEHLDLQDITLCVHDWGGAIGLGAAANCPDRISRLVVTNTCVWPDAKLPKALGLARLPLIGPFLAGTLGLMTRGLSSLCTTQGLTPEVEAGFLAPYLDGERRRGIAAFVRDIPRGPSDQSYETLTAVDAGLALLRHKPTLVLWGMHDWVFTPSVLRGFRERLPRARVTILKEAGHLPLEDAPQECLAALQGFLSST